MSRAAHRFTAREISRLMRALEAEGKSVAAIRVEKDGALVAIFGEPSKAESQNLLDRWLADHAHQA
jgi:hypothetical protein